MLQYIVCVSPIARIHRSWNQILEKGVAHLIITSNGPLVKCLPLIPETMDSIGLTLNSQRRKASTMGHSSNSIKMETENVTQLFLGSLCQETEKQRRFFCIRIISLDYQGKIGHKKWCV